MAYFPIFINLEGKKCLVVGGGAVALRKAAVLLEYGAVLAAAAPAPSPEMCRLAAENPRVSLHRREARIEDAEGMALVVCASNDSLFHRRMALYCKARGIPVNVADDKDAGSFLFPGLVRQEDVVVGITTGGNSPAAVKYLRSRIQKEMPPFFGTLAARLGSLRERIKASAADREERKRAFSRLFEIGMDNGGELPEEAVLEQLRGTPGICRSRILTGKLP